MHLSPLVSQHIVLDSAGVHRFFLQDDSHLSYSSVFHISSFVPEVEILFEGRFFARENAKKHITIIIELQGKKQSAWLNVRAMADDFSSITLKGGVVVTESSSECRAQVHQKLILFSKTAHASATPMLRVETQNIASASHSASIAPFSEALFFFFATRGISYNNAKQLLKESLFVF